MKNRKTRKIMSKKKSLKCNSKRTCNSKRISLSKKNRSNLRKMKGGGGVFSTFGKKKEVEKIEEKIELKEGDIELLDENGKIKDLSLSRLVHDYNKTYQLVSDYIEDSDDSDTSYYKGFYLGKFIKAMRLMNNSYLIEFENAMLSTKYVKQIIFREVEIFTVDRDRDYINLEVLRSHAPYMDEGMMEDINFFHPNSPPHITSPGKYTNGGRKKKYNRKK